MIWSVEKCPKSGELHFQGYVEFEKKIRGTQALKILDRKGIHLAPQGMYEKDGGWFEMNPKPTREQARDYCAKSDTHVDGPWELGVFHESNQGQRNDLVAAVHYVREFGWQLFVENDEFIDTRIRYGKRIQEDYRDWLSAKGLKTRKMNVWVIIGKPGSGKTTEARRMFGDKQWILDYSREMAGKIPWFDKYFGEENVIIDEFKPNIYPLPWLLRILDEHPIKVELKGGSMQFNARNIIITTNDEIDDWYDWSKKENNREALNRRITRGIIRWRGFPGWKPPVPVPEVVRGGNTETDVSGPPGGVPPINPTWRAH